jgi:short-subunit dehydrogenase
MTEFLSNLRGHSNTMERKIVVITGSSRGIGYHMAKEFLRSGHSVILNGRDNNSLEEAKESLTAVGSEILAHPGDVRHENTHRELLEKAIEHFGKIDIWINNAGIPQPYLHFEELDTSSIEKLIQINLLGTMLGSRITIEFFRKQGFGRLYNMEGFGSDGRMMEKLTLYGCSKRAVNYFNQSLYKELKGSGIGMGSINPGMVLTDFVRIDRDFESEKERKRYEKVLNILADEAEPVSQYIVKSILQNSKEFHKINYLSGFKLISKLFRLSFS